MSRTLSIAIFKVVKSKKKECLALIKELFQFLRMSGYSYDLLYLNTKDPNIYINVRKWLSDEAREKAHKDPTVPKFWKKLNKVCKIIKIYEQLEEV